MADIVKYRKLDGTEYEVSSGTTINLGHTEASIEFTVDLDDVAVQEGETRGWFSSSPNLTSPFNSGVYALTISPSQGGSVSVTIQTVDAKSQFNLQNSIFSRFVDNFTFTVSRAAAPADSVTDSVPINYLAYPDSAAALAIVAATFEMTDSAVTFGIVDSSYVRIRQRTYNTSDFLDSTTILSVVDSAYVQARQSLDSALTKQLIDSAYVQARQSLDSALTKQLIDSNYLKLKFKEIDTLDTVVGRGDSTNTALKLHGGIVVTGGVTTDSIANSGLGFSVIASASDIQLNANSGSGVINTLTSKIINVGTPTSNADAATKAYVDSSITNYSKSLNDNVKITFGNDSDLKIYHDTNNSIIEDAGTGSLVLASNNLNVKNATQTETSASFLSGGAVTLNFNNSSRLVTTTYGTTITGTINADSATIGGDVDVGGAFTTVTTTGLAEGNNLYYTTARADSAARSALIAVDAGGDGSFTYDSATGKFTYTGPSATEIRARIDDYLDGGNGITYGSGTIDIDNTVVKTNSPQTIAGIKTFTDNSIFSADVIFDSNGGILFDKSDKALEVNSELYSINLVDNAKINLGSSQDAHIRHTGSNLQFQELTGNIQITNYANDKNVDIKTDDGSGSTALYFRADGSTGSTALYHYGSKKIETTAYGATVTGTLNADSATISGDVDIGGSFTTITTTGLTEGTNLYYTTARADSDARSAFSASNSLSYNSSTGDIRAPQPLDSSANPTFNQLRGPASFVIDPAGVGDSTGTVRILGNLQVEGTQTTIKSTTIALNDKNIVLADSAPDSSALNGGGITWGGSKVVDNPSFTYSHSNARLEANRSIAANIIGNVTGTVSDISNLSTDSLSEGSTNLYFTNERVDDRVGALISGGVNVTATYDDAAGTLEIKVPYENIDDRVANILTAGAGIHVNYDDPGAAITISNTFPDSAWVSARPISTFTNDADYLDSTYAIALIDSSHVQTRVPHAYVQSRQITYNTSDFPDSAFVTGLPISTFTNDANYLDSTTIQGVVNNAYVQARQSLLDSDLAIQLLLDSSEIIQLIDSDYVQLRQSPATDSAATIALINSTVDSAYVAVKTGTALDSATTIAVINSHVDSAYVQVRVPHAYVQSRQITYNTSDFPDSSGVNTLSDARIAAANIGSLNNVSSTGASAGQILKWSGSEWAPAADAGGLDSALTTQLVDSAYVALRAGGGTDSAAVIQLIDSDYISTRVVSFANPTFTNFKFVTDSAGQTVFEGADYFGQTLTFDSHNHSVFVNGIRLLDSDFTADPLINRITLDSTGAANDEIVISTIAGKNALAGISIIDSDYISQRVIAVANPQFINYRYKADGGQTEFGAVTDLGGKTLSLSPSNYTVFLNGIKLLDSDFTANTSTNIITLTSGATLNDELVVTTVVGQNAVAGIAAVDSAYINARVASGTDSSTVISLINSTVNTAYVTARQSLLDSDLALQLLLDSSEIVQLIDSAYINARVSSVDSAATLAIIDSAHVQSKIPHAYIQARQITYNTSDFLDSTTVSGVVNNAYVQARQITYNTSDFLDSTTITGVVDSDYVGLRMSGVIAPKFSNFRYSADSGQTAFTGADMNANTLYLRSGNHSVYVNGVKLIDSDFTSNISTDTITLATGLDSGDELVVTTITGDVIADQSSLIDSDYIGARVGGVVRPTFTDFRYVADSGQTAFTGADLGGTSLDLKTNNFSVFLNGIKLIDSDFTSNISTNTITLTEAADSGDAIIITTLNGDVVTTATAIDSSYIQLRQEGVNAIFKDFKFVATADQTVFSGNDANGAALSFDTEKFHVLLNGIRLDASDFTESAANNRITLASGATVSDEVVISTLSTQRTSTLNAITTTVDSAYVQARQVDLQRDSAYIANIVDSALGTINVIGPSGPIVIGSSTPDTTISGGTPAMQVVGSAFNGIQSITRRDNGAYGPSLILAKSRNTTPGSHTIVQDGDTLGGIIFIGDDGTDLDTYGASITAKVNGSPGANDMPTSLHFNINRGTSSPTEAMRINHFSSTDGFLQPRSMFGWNITGGNTRNAAIHVSGHRYYFPAMVMEDYDTATSYAGTFVTFVRNDTEAGSITSTSASSVSYGTSSDHRMKSNVADLDSAINIVKSLKPKKFKWKSEDSADYNNPFVMGFIAHEADSAIPLSQGIVIGDKDATDSHGTPKMQSMDYGKMTPLVVKALQEALEKIETLEAKVAALEGGG